MSETSRYRVEHHQPAPNTVIAVTTDARPCRCAVDLVLSRLIHEGKTGRAVLVDEATDDVETRRQTVPPERH